MSIPPPKICQQMAKLHAMIGSTVAEASTAREKLMALLAKHGCTWNDLPQILAATQTGRNGMTGSTRSTVPAADAWGQPFRTPDGTAYVDVFVDGHRETWPVRSTNFSHYLRRRMHKQARESASDGAIQQIIKQLEADAQFGDYQREVHLRVGKHDARIYLDLADEQWRAVEISPEGWQLVKDAPIRFRRVPGMLPLPLPQRGGSIDELRPLLNLQNDDDFVLVIAWILATLRGDGPYPVLAITGEHGTAKSGLTETLRFLIDPHQAALRSLSASERDLFVSAYDNFIMAFDNVSTISPVISDALCRIATGGAFTSRKFFQNTGEVAIKAERPIMMNGITNAVTRADLADRTLLVGLKHIPDENRRSRETLNADRKRIRPRVLGALLDAVASGLRDMPHTTLPTMSRMADFELWATACESALWPSRTFGKAYTANRQMMIDDMVESDSVMTAVIRMMADTDGPWCGTATELLARLEHYADERQRRGDRNWPRTPESLRHRFNRAAPHLRREGIEINHVRKSDRKRTRLIEITATETPGTVRTVHTVRARRVA